MALETSSTTQAGATAEAGGSDFKGRHLAIGGNVVFTIVVVIAIAVVLQWLGYMVGGRVDMTSSGVNSLTPGTEKLLSDLGQKIRLTSLYYETDVESDDQGKYRSRIEDLLALYQSANRTQVEVASVNPLKDYAGRQKLIERIQELSGFKTEIEPYRTVIERFQTDLLNRAGAALQEMLDEVGGLVGEGVAEQERNDLIQIQDVMNQWQQRFAATTQTIDDAVNNAQPLYGTATSKMASLCEDLAADLKAVADYAGKLLEQRAGMSAVATAFLSDLQTRHAELIEALNAVAKDARDLKPLDLDSVLRDLGGVDSNALVVATDETAQVLRFEDIWDASESNVLNAGIQHRVFRGEEKLTSAILKLTQKEVPAVVFVRYGGQPLFFAGMPGQPFARAPYAQLKQLLEDANFSVEEWDVSSTATPPEIDPPPSRTIYVVLRPTPPPQGPFAQSQQQPFGPSHLQSVKDAIGENARVIFMAGWMPNQFGMFAEGYEYNDYLQSEWGLAVAADVLLLKVVGVGADRFQLTQASGQVREFEFADHLLVRNLTDQTATFPLAAPIERQAEIPEDVSIHTLISSPRSETLWGVRQPTLYVEKARAGEDFAMESGDETGPFDVAVAAEKGENKIVVISSPNAISDQVALQQVPLLTGQGLYFRRLFPGNMALLLNSLHWLNDKEEWMDLGRPVNAGSIEIAQGSTLTFIKVFAAGIWPAMVVCCGLVAWRVRRR